MVTVEMMGGDRTEKSLRDKTKTKITGLGILDTQKSEQDRRLASSKLVNERVSGASSVARLIEMNDDGDLDARDALVEISEAFYELLVAGGNEEQVVAGSQSVDNLLPEPLKGLGIWVADCAFVDENGELDGSGLKIRKLMDRVDRARHDDPDHFGNKANEVLRQVSQLGMIDSDRVDRSKDVAISYLAQWIQGEGSESYDYHKAYNERIFPPEGQSKDLVRRALEMIESSNVDSHDLSVQSIESWLLMIAGDQRKDRDGKKLTEEKLQLEIQARLALHNTALEMRISCGHLTAKDGTNVQDAIVRLKKMGMLLTREHLAYLMRENVSDMDMLVGDAWDMFQDAICDYGSILRLTYPKKTEEEIKKMLGDPMLRSPFWPEQYSNFFLDDRQDVKEKVREYMVKKLMVGGADEHSARKSVELAEDLIWATGERSLANKAYDSGDKLAELIHFGELLSDDAPKGKNVGVELIRGKIRNLTPGWLRFCSGETDPNKPIYHTEQVVDSETGMVTVEGIAYNKVTGKLNFDTFYSVIIAQKAQMVKELLMGTKMLKPEEIGQTMLMEINDCFSKIDPYDSMALRAWYMAVLLRNVTGDDRTAWTTDDLRRLQEASLEPMAMTKEEREYMDQLDAARVAAKQKPARKRGIDSFLSKDQWKWAVETTKAKSTLRWLTVLNGLIAALGKVR